MATLRSLLLAALLWVPAEALSCYGDSGQPVDWFVVYKLPAHSGSRDTPKGLTYKYMDQNSEGWLDGVGYINSSEGAVGRSLQPLYRKNSSQVSCSWTKKGASGWSTVCLASHSLRPLVHTPGLLMLKPSARPYSVCPSRSLSLQGLASS
uniref:Deoxyribonuclease-2-alpha n=1 Tax=Mus spicilegus TaxID=10103 RepID=A0A8C6H5R0_MUSSI